MTVHRSGRAPPRRTTAGHRPAGVPGPAAGSGSAPAADDRWSPAEVQLGPDHHQRGRRRGTAIPCGTRVSSRRSTRASPSTEPNSSERQRRPSAPSQEGRRQAAGQRAGQLIGNGSSANSAGAPMAAPSDGHYVCRRGVRCRLSEIWGCSSSASFSNKDGTQWLETPQHLPVNWDDILSTTLHNYRKTLTDNIFQGRPLLNYLMSKGRVRKVNGGVLDRRADHLRRGRGRQLLRMAAAGDHPARRHLGGAVPVASDLRDDRHLRPRRGAEQRQGAGHQPARSQDHAGRGDAQEPSQPPDLRHARRFCRPDQGLPVARRADRLDHPRRWHRPGSGRATGSGPRSRTNVGAVDATGLEKATVQRLPQGVGLGLGPRRCHLHRPGRSTSSTSRR